MFSIKTIIIFVALVLIVPIGALVGRQVILKGTPKQYSLSPTTELAIGQALDSPDSPASTWREGKDYRLSDKKYFLDKEWLVATLELTNQGNPGPEPSTVVMKRDGASYQIIVGPGTDFPSDGLPALPQEVLQYLKDIGRVSD
jgi:hypothetical protein